MQIASAGFGPICPGLDHQGVLHLEIRNSFCDRDFHEPTKPMTRATFSEEDIQLAPATHGAPAATEDLMIAEELESMRVRDEHRPGEKCFLWGGDKKWLPSEKVKSFIRDCGADHPTDFAATHGRDWQQVLFGSPNAKSS